MRYIFIFANEKTVTVDLMDDEQDTRLKQAVQYSREAPVVMVTDSQNREVYVNLAQVLATIREQSPQPQTATPTTPDEGAA
jgi:hypothetical protein